MQQSRLNLIEFRGEQRDVVDAVKNARTVIDTDNILRTFGTRCIRKCNSIGEVRVGQYWLESVFRHDNKDVLRRPQGSDRGSVADD